MFDLKKVCEEYLEDKVIEENYLEMFQLAKDVDSGCLHEGVFGYIKDNFKASFNNFS